MAASVWMPSGITEPSGACRLRLVAETMPEVSVKESPKGLPIATTGSPTKTPAESPNGRGCSAGTWLGSTLSRATSVASSPPTSVAFTFVLLPLESFGLLKTTSTELAARPSFMTTWALVITSPSLETRKPDPSPCPEADGPAPENVARTSTTPAAAFS